MAYLGVIIAHADGAKLYSQPYDCRHCAESWVDDHIKPEINRGLIKQSNKPAEVPCLCQKEKQPCLS